MKVLVCRCWLFLNDLYFMENKHCASEVDARRGFLSLGNGTCLKKTSIVLLWYRPAGAFFPLRKSVCSSMCVYSGGISVVFLYFFVSRCLLFIIAHPGHQSRIKSRRYVLAVVFCYSVVSAIRLGQC